MDSAPPNPTLYVKNLNGKVKKDGKDGEADRWRFRLSATSFVFGLLTQFCIIPAAHLELKQSLYALFTTYGFVLDIVATKIGTMRGQAFIVFNEVPSAAAAMRALQGFNFYDKPMVSATSVVSNSTVHLVGGLI